MSESKKYIEYGKVLNKGFNDGLKEIHVDSETEVIKMNSMSERNKRNKVTKKAPEEFPRL